MLLDLTPDELARYDWQLAVRGFGEEGQRKLKAAKVLVSRIGGVGGSAAAHLAAAGIGKLVLAHAGQRAYRRPESPAADDDRMDRQAARESALLRLPALNPHVELETIAENASEANAADLVRRCDLVVNAAPLFTERLLLNREAVRQRKPLVDCAMYELEGRVTTILPGQTPCLACLYPEPPPNWKRKFPVFSGVASTVGSLAAMEAIKVIAGLGTPLAGQLLTFDLRDMTFRSIPIARRGDCAICGNLI